MRQSTKKRTARIRRHHRVRAKLSGTEKMPRLSIFRSSQHIYAQLIDDVAGKTLLSVSTLKSEGSKVKKADLAKKAGQELAKLAKSKGFGRVAFDRGGYAYHGRIKALAEGARMGGLEF